MSDMISSSSRTIKRGSFIVFEGLDRSGKSTQLNNLFNHHHATVTGNLIKYNFPNRSTTIGTMINNYLTQTTELDDRAIHLLFSANRWERAKSILADLEAGHSVICDRYAFSGIAFSAAKGLSYSWCRSPDIGLPAPDLVLFLDLSPEAAALRGGYGSERYEEAELQSKVRKIFQTIGEDVGKEKWKVVDAGRTEEEVGVEIRELVRGVIEKEKGEVDLLWVD